MTMSQDWDDAEHDVERRKKVGNYVLGPCLGEGTFAKVRIATHIISKEKVAVKIVSKRVIVRRDVARRNFRREALLLQHVRHPNIVRLYEAMETPNSYYLVFELAQHGNLLTLLTQRKCLEESEGRHFMRQMVSSVDHLHRTGIVHRDLKLENFLLSSERDIKLVDFGLSAMCQRESALHTQCGSPVYAAPEIFGNRKYGPPVDIWSMGVCLYAMVVGRFPFMADPPTNLPQLHSLILKGAVIPTFLSASLQQLLTGLLEVQESRRMSITDVLSQSWLTCHRTQPIARYPPVAQAPPTGIDTNCVKYMTTMFRFTENDVIHSVTERKLNASSATYHLLMRHVERDERRRSSRVSKMDEEAEAEFEAEDGRGLDGCGNKFKETNSENARTNHPRALPPLDHAPGSNNNPLIPYSEDNDYVEEGQSKDNVGVSEPKDELPLMNSKEIARHYKQCILFLKEARNGMALRGRPYTDIPRDNPKDDVKDRSKTSTALTTTPSNNHSDHDFRKLPLLNVLRHATTQQQQLNVLGSGGGGGTTNAGHQKVDNTVRHFYVNPFHSQDFKLDVKGHPALREKVIGETKVSGAKEDVSKLGGVGGQKPARLPPAPPNTAQGSRSHNNKTTSSSSYSNVQDSEYLAITPRPNSASSSVNPYLRDPFGRDTWSQSAAHRPLERLRLAGHIEAGGGLRSRGVAFVSPLSSPKALTNREEGPAVTKDKRPGYYVVRQLAADLNRKRLSPSHKKPREILHRSFTTHHHHNSSNIVGDYNDDFDDDDHDDDVENNNNKAHSDSEETLAEKDSSFLTPVIRVTITSTAKR